MPTASSRTTASRSWSPGPELQALIEAAVALAGRVPSGRVALARAEEVLGKTPAHEPLDATTVGRVARRFDAFDPDPIAVRAAAQTHRGMADGRPVAIRIRRPGLDRMVRSDMALLDALAVPLAAAVPNVDAGALLRSIREQVLDELDFEHEASMHRRVARLLRDVDGVVVPAVHTDLCTEDVFVADLLDAQDAAPKDAARVLVTVHVAAARAGIALMDARPGHVLAPADGRIGLLGVGVARPVDGERAGQAFDALYAATQSTAGPLGAVSRMQPHPDDLWLARGAAQLAATLVAMGAR